MHYALENYHSRVYHFIIGIVLSSTILILVPNPGNSESIHYANTSIITLVTAASRRSLGRVSVPMWPFTLSGRLRIIVLVGRYLTN